MLKEIKALCEGMQTVFKHLFRKPVTLEYPEKKRILNDSFRGKLKVDGCVGCMLCKKVCPTGAISIEKEDKKIISRIDLKKCIFCGNCTFYCPKGAIKMTQEYELATQNKEELVLKFVEEKCDDK